MTGERGSATVIGAFAILALLSLSLMVAHVGLMVAAEHRVQGVADSAALAGAAHAMDGEVEVCAAARMAAAGLLTDCRLEKWDAVVTVSQEVGGRAITVSARAGPVKD
ncbi:MAG: flp pilus-assembly TadE/G-like family protein [Nocardiaceae bacterium]|nr:flp pilus-assembly TadE/G-like family protein [Nocardiaceae bacterium]